MAAPVPKGPLAVRWHGCRLGAIRAGALTSVAIELENAGGAVWRARPHYDGIHLGYHWLDQLGNAIVWDGVRTPVVGPVPPGTRLRLDAAVRGPMPPGRYRLAFDLVDEGRFWFEELGNAPFLHDVGVGVRVERALAARGGDPAALAAQEEPLVGDDEAEAVAYLAPGVAPAPDWSRRILDAHQEGYAVVGGSVDTATTLLRRRPRALEPWAPGAGRVPHFAHPLLCPSVVRGIDLAWVDDVEGLPTLRPPSTEPWLYDGRIVVRVPSRRR